MEAVMPMTPQQAADRLGVGVSVVYRAIESGSLRARHKRGQSRRWWVTEADLAHWAEEGMFEEEPTS